MIEHADMMNTLEDLLKQEHELTLPASGFSMGRIMADADALVITAVTHHPLPIGSIVVFKRDNQWWAHRVIWHYFHDNTFSYITKGDAIREIDKPHVNTQDVVGKVSAYMKDDSRINLSSLAQRLAGWCRACFIKMRIGKHQWPAD